MDAHQAAGREELERLMWAAWHTGLFGRAEPMPKLQDMLAPFRSDPDSPDQPAEPDVSNGLMNLLINMPTKPESPP